MEIISLLPLSKCNQQGIMVRPVGAVPLNLWQLPLFGGVFPVDMVNMSSLDMSGFMSQKAESPLLQIWSYPIVLILQWADIEVSNDESRFINVYQWI